MRLGDTGGNKKGSRFGGSVIFPPHLAGGFFEVRNDFFHRWNHKSIIGQKRRIVHRSASIAMPVGALLLA